MTPSLAKLMNLLWLHHQNHFNDEQFCDVIRDGLSDDVLKQWNDYMSSEGDQANNLETSFMGKEQKGVGNYSARTARWLSKDWERLVFGPLIKYERYPDRYNAKSRRERLIDIIDAKNRKMEDRLPNDLMSEVELLERKYRIYRKRHYAHQKHWNDGYGNIVNRKGEIVIPRKDEREAEK